MHHTIQSRTCALLLVLCCAGTSAPAQSDRIPLRQIVVASPEDADDIRRRADAGSPFDVLAAEHSLDAASAARGGYMGRIDLTDLRREFRDAVAGLAAGEVSVPTEVDGVFFLFQAVSEAEAEWIDLDDAGAAALAGGRNAQSGEYFRQALALAETHAPDSPQLLRSLDSLAAAYHLLDRPAESEALYRRALPLLDLLDASALERAQVLNGLGLAVAAQGRHAEAEPLYGDARRLRVDALGAGHPEVAAIDLNRADLDAAAGRFLEAAALYNAAVTQLEASLGTDHPATAAARERRAALGERLVPALLDRFSTIVSLAEFKDNGYPETVSELERLLPLVPLTERSYVQMKDILLEVALGEETETVLRVGLEKFADSRILRIYLADLLANTGRTADALGVLREAAALPTPAGLDAATDRVQQGVIFQRIGDIQSALTDFDAAVAAYERSLSIDPVAPDGRIKLGRAHFANNRVDEALAEYERAAAENSDDQEAHLNRAEVYLARGEWGPAAAAAEQAIDRGTTDSRALYILGTALVRLGRVGDGQEQLRKFQEVETGFRDIEHQNREVDATSLAAIGALRAGDGGAAVNYLEEGIALFPDAGRLHMNLAMVQIRLGRREVAVETYERMLELGVGRRFLIHRNLAEEYAALGDLEASERHRAVYLETREDELIVYAPE